MVEPLLYAALGFLTASLIALFMGRALWNRAVRLTTLRIMRRLPLSRDEIVASRDLLRAEVAIEHRRLERLANIMRTRMTQSMADVGRRDATIMSMRTTVEDATAKAAQTEAQARRIQSDFEKLKAEYVALKNRLTHAEGTLTEKEREERRREQERGELMQLADSRRLETANAAAELGQVRLGISALEQQLEAAAKELTESRSKLDQANAATAMEHERAESIHAKLVAAEAQLAQTLNAADTESRASQSALDQLRADKTALERELANLRAETEKTVSMNSEDLTALRAQIERLAGDIARAAGGAKAGGSSLRASMEADAVSAPVTSPPVR